MYIKTLEGIIAKPLGVDNKGNYIMSKGYISKRDVAQTSNDIKDLFDFYMFIIDGQTYVDDTFDLKLVTQEPSVLYYGCTLFQGGNNAPILISRAIYENGKWRIL